MAIKRVNATVQGRVQGVFFRACTQDEAQRLGLSGWVRNKPDGSVETEFQGEESKVNQMVDWLHRGSPMSHVLKVVTSSKDTLEGKSRFQVKY